MKREKERAGIERKIDGKGERERDRKREREKGEERRARLHETTPTRLTTRGPGSH